MKTLHNNICPINLSNPNNEGYGFFIGHYFITAAHVVKGTEKPFIVKKGERIYLENPIFNKFDNPATDSLESYDLAVYYVPDFYAELDFYNEDIVEEMRLNFASYKAFGEIPIDVNVVVVGVGGNYFGGLSEMNLSGGCSGSPIMYEGKVAGMMVSGNINEDGSIYIKDLPLNFCRFQKSSAIKRILEKKYCIVG